jgi:hypothetical protein
MKHKQRVALIGASTRTTYAFAKPILREYADRLAVEGSPEAQRRAIPSDGLVAPSSDCENQPEAIVHFSHARRIERPNLLG